MKTRAISGVLALAVMAWCGSAFGSIATEWQTMSGGLPAKVVYYNANTLSLDVMDLVTGSNTVIWNSGDYANHKWPAWSPDGTHIVCRNNGKPMVMNADGSTRVVATTLFTICYGSYGWWSSSGTNDWIVVIENNGTNYPIKRLQVNLTTHLMVQQITVVNMTPLGGSREFASMSGNYVAWWDPDSNYVVDHYAHQDYIMNWATSTMKLVRPNTDPNGGCNINIKKDGSGTYIFNYPHHFEPAPIENFTAPGTSLGSITPVGGGVTSLNRFSPCGNYMISRAGEWGPLTSDLTGTATHSYVYKIADGTHIDLGAGVIEADLWTATKTITVTSPNGGENWSGGNNATVTWTSTGGVGNVKIEISTNNGSTWSTLVADTTNDGTEIVTAPSVSSSQCLVKVSEVAGGATDTSDATFTITYVDVVAPTVVVDKAVLTGTVYDAVSTPTQVVANGSVICPVTTGNWSTPDMTVSGASTTIVLTASDASGNTRTVNVVITK